MGEPLLHFHLYCLTMQYATTSLIHAAYRYSKHLTLKLFLCLTSYRNEIAVLSVYSHSALYRLCCSLIHDRLMSICSLVLGCFRFPLQRSVYLYSLLFKSVQSPLFLLGVLAAHPWRSQYLLDMYSEAGHTLQSLHPLCMLSACTPDEHVGIWTHVCAG